MSPNSPGEDSTRIRDPLLGSMLDEYLVVGPLGEGGMGVVYEGLHTVINKRVAIKVIKSEFAGDEVLVRRLLAEAQAVNAVRHRGIVDIHAHGRTPDGRPYLVMEMLHGETLYDLLMRQGRLSRHEALKVLLEATGPLLAAHRAGIVHRDLKPSNLFLCVDDDGERFLKLLDFGLAKRTAPGSPSSTMTSASLIVGTPDYIAPEQARALPTDARTDIYALGVLTFQLLAGQLPFVAASSVDLVVKHLSAPVPRLIDVDPSIPVQLSELVEQMMAKDPEQRPQSLEPVREVLKQQSIELPNSFPVVLVPGLFKATPTNLSLAPVPIRKGEPDEPLPLAPKADRTLIAETPNVRDEGTHDAMPREPGAPLGQTPSGSRRRDASEGEGNNTKTTLAPAVVSGAEAPPLAIEEALTPSMRSSRGPLLVAGALVLVILLGLIVVFSGDTEKMVVIGPVPVVEPETPSTPDMPMLSTVETTPGDVKPVETKPVETKPVETKPVPTKPLKPALRVRKVPTIADLTSRLNRLSTKVAAAGTTDKMLEKKYRKQLSENPNEALRFELGRAIETLEKRLNRL
jgi:serine/threonine protein kinase